MTHELRIERLIDAPVELVFDTFVDPDKQAEIHGEGQPGWLIHRAETDVRVGGMSTYQMGAEGQEPDTEIRRFTVVDRPNRLEFTHHMIVPSEGLSLETVMTITFEDRDGKTLVTFVQGPFERVEDRDGFGEGWREMLATLDRVAREGLKARHDTEGVEARDETGV
jgi:uncharacterized protein YndB with AHSA1/START domain